MTRLVVDSGIDRGMVFPLSQPVVTMGRSASNAIQIIDRRISRHHAEILYINGEYVLRDLGSKNGTYVNENLITEDKVLESGDQIRIGETVLVFEFEPGKEKPSDTTSKIVRIAPEPAWGKTTDTLDASKSSLAPTEEKREIDIKDSHQRLGILYRITDTIRSILSLDELLQKIVDIIYEVLSPDCAFIMLRDPKTGNLVPRAVQKMDTEEEIQVSNSVVEKCLGEMVSILVSDASSDERFSSAESVIKHKIRSAICSPLVYKDEVLGVVYIDSKTRLVSYDKGELELLTSISNQAAIAIANAKLHSQLIEQHKIEREMEIARSIQMNLLPKSYPPMVGYEVAAMSLPAKKVGGDYYDFIKLPNGKIGFLIADISGKGVAAAILAATLRASIQIYARQPTATVPNIVSQMNEIICRDSTNNMFATMVYGVIDPETGNFEYTNAGHCRPLIFGPRGKMVQLEKGNCFLGLAQNIEYEIDNVTLEPGRTLLFYTDGVTDTMQSNGELFGIDRVVECVKRNINLSVLQLRDALYEEVLEFSQGTEQFDDFTLVILRRLEEKNKK